VEDLDEVDEVYILPMLAHPYDKRKKYMKFPCIGQRKFDGIRCLAYINKEDKVVLMSRKGKKFPNLDHLLYSVDLMLGNLVPEQVYLDGELYSDELTFQEITGICRRQTLREGDEEKIKKIKYRVYDVITPEKPDMPFKKRYEGLTKLVKRDRKGNVILTENFQVRTEQEMKKLHDKFVYEGYEGLILRNLNGVYGINKRSNDLLKYKAFQDDEYEIVGYTEGTGKDEGTVIWTCKTKKKQEFNVRPRGTHEERTHWFDNGDKYVGSKLTVRFFELTDDGIPRFPVGISIRDYE
jgi:DNA ligase-1